MNKYFRQGFVEGGILGCIVGLILSVLFLARSIDLLQDQIDNLRQRNEVITQQLQEMNKYVQYPGG